MNKRFNEKLIIVSLFELCSSFLFSDCTSKYDCTTWSGANDIDTEGVFIWEHSGLPVSYTNWDDSNPDNINDPSNPIDCVDLFYNGEWNDRPCTILAAFVCEK